MDQKVFEKELQLFSRVVGNFIKPALRQLEQEQLTEVQLVCMRFVHLHQEPSLGAIAAGLGISAAAAAKLVDRLVKKKLLIRAEDSRDRRVLKIRLTKAGTELWQQVNRQAAAELDRVLSQLSAAELEALQLGLGAFLRQALSQSEAIETICLRCGREHLRDCPGNLRYRELTGEDQTKI